MTSKISSDYLDSVDIRAALILVEAIALLDEHGHSEFRPCLFESVINQAELRNKAFALLVPEKMHELVDRLYRGYLASGRNGIPISPLSTLGWFAREFEMVLEVQYPVFTQSLRAALSHSLGFPITELSRSDYVLLRQLVIGLSIPEQAILDHLRLAKWADRVIEHSLGYLVPIDLVERIRAIPT